MKKNFRPAFYFLAVLFVLVLLTACGGGGSSSRSPGDPPPVDEGNPPPAENTPPVAEAGADQETVEGNLVTLDGTGSTDADGDDLSYSWRFVSELQGVLSDPAASSPTFQADQVGSYVLELIVSDGVSSSLADSVTITAKPLPDVQPVVASWPYNLSSVREETDSDGNGEIDFTYFTTYNYGPDGRVASSQKVSVDTKQVLEAESFTYREDGLLDTTIMVKPVGQYSRSYHYENGLLVSAVASGIVQNVFSYTYAGGMLSRIVSDDQESDFQYDGELLTGAVTVDESRRVWSYIFEGNQLVEEEYTLDNVGPMVKVYTYENGILTSIKREIDYQKDGVPEAVESTSLYYDGDGNLQRAEYSYSDLVTGKIRYKYVFFVFNPKGMPTTGFAYGYPLYGAKKEPLVPRIVKTFFVD